jgi:hypothetical protein
MSLRPRQDPAALIARGRARMAPGRGRWSESPIPRVATRLVRARPVPLVEPLSGGFNLYEGKDLSTLYSDTVGAVPSSLPEADTLHWIVLTAGFGAITPPSGWSVLASGEFATGGLHYCIAWAKVADAGLVASGVGLVFTSSAALSTTVCHFFNVATGIEPKCSSAVTTSGATTHPLQNYNPAWITPFPVLFLADPANPSANKYSDLGDGWPSWYEQITSDENSNLEVLAWLPLYTTAQVFGACENDPMPNGTTIGSNLAMDSIGFSLGLGRA